MIAAPAASLLIIRIFIENLPLHPGSSPDISIYNDINAVGVNPDMEIFAQGGNAPSALNSMLFFATDEIFLWNREKNLASSEKFVTM
jgi:hypothetical protein